MKPLLLEILGDLDAYAAGFIATAMTGVDDEAGVVFDVGGVSFIDSAGLGCLEACADDVLADGRRVWLHDPSTVVRRLLAILEIDRFEICEAVSPLDSLRHDRFAPVPSTLAPREIRRQHCSRCRAWSDDRCHHHDIATGRFLGPHQTRNDVVYTVGGELDAASARRIAGCGLLCVDRVGIVTLDLAGVTIIDT